MGAVAGANADRVVVTSDNPRSEVPEVIISQILLGLTGARDVFAEPNRLEAITRSLKDAAANDVVLVAGKGHEDYQEIAGKRLPFSDMAVVRAALGLAAVSASAQGIA
jgi:UDP-N-acetylmuramoyl-L-alanyl-D-glutamate--2,6-diaminopimelate ligase